MEPRIIYIACRLANGKVAICEPDYDSPFVQSVIAKADQVWIMCDDGRAYLIG